MMRMIQMIAAALIAAAPGAQAADSWTGADKGKHAAAGAWVAGSVLQMSGDARLALFAGAAAGISKELSDMGQPGHVPSYRDAAVTIAGALIAVHAPGLIITPLSVSYRAAW